MPPALFLVSRMINTILGTKAETKQRFTQDGKRIPVTEIKTGDFVVVQIKTMAKDGYDALQLGLGQRIKKTPNKALTGHLKASTLKQAPVYLLEAASPQNETYKPGDTIKFTDVVKEGDIIKVTGWSKGKGFAGVVKRHGFKGGPKTHGQSDRQRSPGSIGQGTTPGRVYKGKRMAGRMGNERVTIKNLLVMEVNAEDNTVLVKGLVPGPKTGKIQITKIGELKKFVPLLTLGEKNIQETEEEKATRQQREKDAEEQLKEAPKGATSA